MSHVAQCKVEITDLKSLKKAAEALGFEWREGQKTYQWFGRHVGDYPMPEGFTAADLGKCDHAIHIPGVDYEIGVVKRGKRYHVLFDFWDRKLLKAVGGETAPKLAQRYTLESAKRQARLLGHEIRGVKTEKDGSLRLLIAE